MNQEKINKLSLVVILIVAFFLRTMHLGSIPKGLQSDEASFLINSVALLETGRDEDNKTLPLFLDSLIDSKPALYSYLQIPFIKFLGATTQSSRLPSALLGTLSIYLFYLFLGKIFTKRVALIGALFLALSPWHIMNSRATQEVILSFTIVVANLLSAHTLFYKKLTKKHLILFFVTAITAMYVYHAAKIVLVLFYSALGFIALIFKEVSKSQQKSILILAGISIFCFAITAGAALTRFSAIGLLNDDLPKALIFESTTKATPYTPLYAIRAFYNKPVMYFTYFLKTYLAHFDLNFLFTIGGATRRFIVPYHGLFYLFELLLIPLGIFALIKNKTKLLIFWLLLLLISPIPAALTTEEIPSSIRTFTLLIPLTIASALGMDWLLSTLNKKMKIVFVTFFGSVLAWSVGYFVQQMFVMMPLQNTQYRSRSYEIVTEYIASHHTEYESVQFASDLREMYIYLWQKDLISIAEIQAQPSARYSNSYSIGKFYFTKEVCTFPEVQHNSLLVAPYSCAKTLVGQYKELATANFDDLKPGFVIVTNKTTE